nr:polysaccharide biosynthesis tyrosine autokinase [Arthrobacter ginsengisoli]
MEKAFRGVSILELSDYLRVLRRHWVMIAAFSMLGLAVAGAASMAIRPTYTAKTQLFVAIQSSGSVSELQQGNTFSQARVQSYVETVGSPSVLQPVIDRLGLHVSAAELGKNVSASSDSKTVIISISAADPSPVQAAAIAQAVGSSLIDAIEAIESPAEGGKSPVRLSVITPASAPVSPSAPNTRLNLALGLASGLLIGLGLAVLKTVMDTKIRGEADLLRVTDKPILGGISFDSDATKKPLLTQAPAQSPRAESFRQIRTNLQFAHVSHGSKAVLVTSSLPGEGKSTTATNLAIAMAQSGQTVVLIDADLRRPRICDYLGLDSTAGLTTALIGEADVNDLLQPWGEDNLYVLTSGQVPPNPSELLGSEAMKDLIVRLEAAFDAVIIDAPPLLPVTDAAVLAQQVGGVVLVVGATRVRTPELKKSLEALEMVEADLLGLVLNLLPSKGPDAYAYSYYSYDSSQRPLSRPPISASRMEEPARSQSEAMSSTVARGRAFVRGDSRA